MSLMNSLDRKKESEAKFKRELEHFNYLKQKGYNSLDIADKLIHEVLETLKFGIILRNPKATIEDIKQKMMLIALQDQKIKKWRRSRNNV